MKLLYFVGRECSKSKLFPKINIVFPFPSVIFINFTLLLYLYFSKKKEASKLLTKSKYFSNTLTTIITNVLRTS